MSSPEPMMGSRANEEWLVKEFPDRSLAYARSIALILWRGFIWQRRNREDA